MHQAGRQATHKKNKPHWFRIFKGPPRIGGGRRRQTERPRTYFPPSHNNFNGFLLLWRRETLMEMKCFEAVLQHSKKGEISSWREKDITIKMERQQWCFNVRILLLLVPFFALRQLRNIFSWVETNSSGSRWRRSSPSLRPRGSMSGSSLFEKCSCCVP